MDKLKPSCNPRKIIESIFPIKHQSNASTAPDIWNARESPFPK
jgi:hypothetical protein